MEFGVDSIVQGKVTGITKFGAFVSLPEGKSGLVHISEIAYSYVNEVSDHLQVGQEVTVKVIGIDEAGRINLSIKKALPPPPRQGGEGSAQGSRSSAPRRPAPQGFSPRSTTPPGPPSFEDRLKQFMQQSDSKLSEIRAADRRNTRRGNGRGR